MHSGSFLSVLCCLSWVCWSKGSNSIRRRCGHRGLSKFLDRPFSIGASQAAFLDRHVSSPVPIASESGVAEIVSLVELNQYLGSQLTFFLPRTRMIVFWI